MLIYNSYMAIFFAMLALIGWGSGDVLIAKLTRKIGSRVTLFWWMFSSLILSSLYLPFAGPIPDFLMFSFALILNIFGLLGVIWYVQAFEQSHISLVGTIAGSFSILVVPLSVIFFSERLEILQIGAIIMTITGLILATLHPEDLKNRNFRRLSENKGIKLSFLAFLNWGIYWTLIRIPVQKIGWYWSEYPFYFMILLLPLMGMTKNISISAVRNSKILFMIILSGALSTMANFSFNLGITYGYSSIVAPIAGSSPVLFVILSRFVFREPLTGQQKLGIISALTGIVLIGFNSV